MIEELTKPEELVIELGCGPAAFGLAALFLNREYIGIESRADVAGAAHTRLLVFYESFKERKGELALE